MTTATESGPLMVDTAWVAEQLGVCDRSVRRMEQAGRIPGRVKIGGAVRFNRGVILRWIDAGCPPRKAFESIGR